MIQQEEMASGSGRVDLGWKGKILYGEAGEAVNRLPGVVGAPSLETLKRRLDGFLGKTIGLQVSLCTAGELDTTALRDPFRPTDSMTQTPDETWQLYQTPLQLNSSAC